MIIFPEVPDEPLEKPIEPDIPSMFAAELIWIEPVTRLDCPLAIRTAPLAEVTLEPLIKSTSPPKPFAAK